ncbi:MAG: hypothetical protein IMY69_03120, partial [Bacteroidetes bacterium]|nr:hypothetical protein [Bacteroidota bacterium]
AGTTLTETCDLKNKHGLTNEARITIQSEKYFPTSGVIPTADSATATTLRDAALASAVLGNDYFNGCWVFIVHGTGTDNGFVPITDYVDTTGDVVVASWPGTQPDNTSRYLIVGALIDGGSARNDGINIVSCTVSTDLRGVGCKDVLRYSLSIAYSGIINCNYDGVYNIYYSGVYCSRTILPYLSYCGIVKCNTSDTSTHGGIKAVSANQLHVRFCGISDNNKRGIYVTEGSFASTPYNFGDGNGTWGIYCEKSGQAAIVAPECSGSSGNHSDPGTAGTASADQASAY